MFSGGFRSTKFSTTARLSINRLKLLEKKKTEQAQKARKEIADYLAMGKDERARIRVEHIIREDYLVEGMEIVELYLDLLLARLGLIQATKTLDPGIAEAVASVIWVTPRMSAEVAELKSVSEQLVLKYGREFGDCCKKGESESINEGLKHKLGVQAPSRRLVESYLVEIAKSHSVAYEPDPSILSPPEIEGLLMDLGDEVLSGNKKGPGGGGGGGSSAPPQQHSYPPPAHAYPPPVQAYPPPAQAYPPPANPAYPPPANPAYPPPAMQSYPPPQSNAASSSNSRPPAYNNVGASRGPPSLPNKPPVGPVSPLAPGAPPGAHSPAPPYSENDPMYPPKTNQGNLAPSAPKPDLSVPDLPQVPTNSFPPLDNSVGGNSAGGEDVDFDDLSRRFEELKKKK
ncbi:IST1 homolog isoform X1 [Asterias amurensis]|uniref:IST1 homolog isoform X1 n=1 Tax=Asterias amurensis TaxID=7602 RepID=UPI003AB393D2